MESKIILYHSNKEEECNKFIKNDCLIYSTNNKDDIWLGNGMYFWDNLGNAKWWNNKQKQKKPRESFIIAMANVNIDSVLDLTDYEIYMKMEELWKTICTKANLNPNVPLGNKLNYLFDTTGFKSVYSVIKVYGKYNSTPNKGLFKFDYSSMKAEPTMAVKCIYNVRDEQCIIEKELFNEEVG